MFRLLQYYGRFQNFRGDLIGLPAWGRVLLFLAALPGILLLALSIFALLVSVLALLLLTVPLYRLLKAIGPARGSQQMPEPHAGMPGGRKRVEVTIVE